MCVSRLSFFLLSSMWWCTRSPRRFSHRHQKNSGVERHRENVCFWVSRAREAVWGARISKAPAATRRPENDLLDGLRHSQLQLQGIGAPRTAPLKRQVFKFIHFSSLLFFGNSPRLTSEFDRTLPDVFITTRSIKNQSFSELVSYQ